MGTKGKSIALGSKIELRRLDKHRKATDTRPLQGNQELVAGIAVFDNSTSITPSRGTARYCASAARLISVGVMTHFRSSEEDAKRNTRRVVSPGTSRRGVSPRGLAATSCHKYTLAKEGRTKEQTRARH